MPETLGIRIFEVLKFQLQKDVLFRDVVKDKGDIGFILRVCATVSWAAHTL